MTIALLGVEDLTCPKYGKDDKATLGAFPLKTAVFEIHSKYSENCSNIANRIVI